MLPRGQANATHGRPQRGIRTMQVKPPLQGPKLISGDGTPSSSTGNTNDLYIDTSSGHFYGPKKPSSGWGTPLV